jgi:hypothetical protein
MNFVLAHHTNIIFRCFLIGNYSKSMPKKKPSLKGEGLGESVREVKMPRDKAIPSLFLSMAW